MSENSGSNNNNDNKSTDLLSAEKVEEIVNIVKDKTVEGVTQAYSLAAEKTEEVYHYVTSEEAKQKLQETVATTSNTLSSAYSWFSSNVTSLVGDAYSQVSSALTGDHGVDQTTQQANNSSPTNTTTTDESST